MKAKFYTLILSALLLAGLPAKAQFADNRDYRNDDAGIVINNYYDDYDYYYSSRINRFHRSYAAFDYYSPVFTETYWYNYQPYSWGTSIYGRSALGFGFAVNFPVYYYGWGTDYWYDYNYGWYDPYYGSSWYWGYDPFYYSWYSPVYININIGPRWGHNYWHNNYRPVYHTTNNYYYDNYSNRNSYRSMPDRNRTGEYNRSTGGSSRRETVPSSGRVNQAGSRSSEGQVNINQGRRTAPYNSRGSSGNAGNNANNGNNQNSRTDGNNGNFNRNNHNTNNNGNNNNSRPDGNNGNFGDKGRVTASPGAPSRSSSSQKSGSTVSKGRSSSGKSENRSSGQSSRSGSSSSSKSSSKSSSGTRSSSSKNSGSRR